MLKPDEITSVSSQRLEQLVVEFMDYEAARRSDDMTIQLFIEPRSRARVMIQVRPSSGKVPEESGCDSARIEIYCFLLADVSIDPFDSIEDRFSISFEKEYCLEDGYWIVFASLPKDDQRVLPLIKELMVHLNRGPLPDYLKYQLMTSG